MNKIKALRKSAQLTQKALSELLNIPKRTIENWEAGVNEPPEYLVKLIEYYLKNENYIKMEDMKMTHNIKIWIASDSSHGAEYTAETDTLDIVEIAYKYGRAESGEIVTLIEIDGTETDVCNRPTAFWDDQYHNYKTPQKA